MGSADRVPISNTGSKPKRFPDLAGPWCVRHRGVGEMGVSEGRVRALVAEQPADGRDGLALPEGDAGVGMA